MFLYMEKHENLHHVKVKGQGSIDHKQVLKHHMSALYANIQCTSRNIIAIHLKQFYIPVTCVSIIAVKLCN